MIPATQIWNFSTLLSAFSKPSSSLSVPVSAFGEPLTSWKATETTTPALMLVYDKEASNKTIGRKPRYFVINQIYPLRLDKFVMLVYTVLV